MSEECCGHCDDILHNSDDDVSIAGEGARFVNENRSPVCAWEQTENHAGPRHGGKELVEEDCESTHAKYKRGIFVADM